MFRNCGFRSGARISRVSGLLCLCLALFSVPAAGVSQADRVRFQRFGVEDGLSHSVVRSIVHGREGFLWIATTAGLDRFDAYTFKAYRHDPEDTGSLSDSKVRVVYQTASGETWIGTQTEGLNRLSPGSTSFDHFRHVPTDATSLPGNLITSILENGAGELWVGTSDGLARFERSDGSFVRYVHTPETPDGLSNNAITTLAEAADGDLWIGTRDGLNRFERDEERFVQYLHDPEEAGSLPGNRINTLLIDRNSTVWVGTYQSGLARFDTESGTFFRYRKDPREPGALSSNAIKALHEDTSGRIWIGTWGTGLDRLDPGAVRFHHYPHNPDDPRSLSDNRVYAIQEDRLGQLWVATHSGLNRFDPAQETFLHYQHEPGNANSLINNQVESVLEDRNGILWIGTYAGGLSRYDRESGTFTNFRHDPDDPYSLANNGIWAIHENEAGLWFGTSRGLHRFDEANNRFLRYQKLPDDPAPLLDNNVLSLHTDRSGDLWIGTWEGALTRFEPGREVFTHYAPGTSADESAPMCGIWSILEDSAGRMWFGCAGGGLYRFDHEVGQEGFRRYGHNPKRDDTLSSSIIRSLYEDRAGRFWIGTNDGLDQWRPDSDSFVRFAAHSGLDRFPVYGIRGDDDGNLWLSSDRGIARFTPETASFTWYDEQDGLQGRQFTTGAVHQGRSGRIYFGGSNGLTEFDPNQVVAHLETPPVVLTEFLLLNEPVSREHEASSFEALAEGEITLKPTDYFFSFEFAALNFRQPEKNQYAYKMEGVDPDWVHTDSNHRRASYTLLPPGSYTFRVKASNDDGVWNEEGTSIRVRVLPPWWKTFWFRVSATLVALGMLFVAFRWRERTARQRQGALEALVGERTRELADSNEKLEQLSLTDALTGMRNRRFLHEHIHVDIGTVLREHRTAMTGGNGSGAPELVFILIDLDLFKSVNDTHGHDAGDRVLVSMSELLRNVCRESDVVVRWGGEEFLAVGRFSDRDHAFEAAERIRLAVSQHPFDIGESESLALTCSVGCASFPFLSEEPERVTWEQVLTIADRALYTSKASGRNRTVFATATKTTDVERVRAAARTGLEQMESEGEIALRVSPRAGRNERPKAMPHRHEQPAPVTKA